MKVKGNLKELLNVEDDFFELDHDKKIAYMRLEFDKPSDIFDSNSKTKLPVLSDDFLEWISSAFEFAPKKYKIDLNVSFVSLEGYTESDLQEIFRKNVMLEFKKNEGKAKAKNKIAYGLIAIGVVFFIGMLLLNNLWKDGGIVKDIFSYVSDIATTVTFWEAMVILLVESAERRSYMRNLIGRFSAIHFKKRADNE